jgi:hypothetical protein
LLVGATSSTIPGVDHRHVLETRKGNFDLAVALGIICDALVSGQSGDVDLQGKSFEE